MHNNKINICYANDEILIADNEGSLQRLLHRAVKTGKTYNLKVSRNKKPMVQSLSIFKEPIRCILEIDRNRRKKHCKTPGKLNT